MTGATLVDGRHAKRLEPVLTALGAVYRTHSLPELLDESDPARRDSALIVDEEHLPASRPLLSRYQHVLVYPFTGSAGGLRTLQTLIDGVVTVRRPGARACYAVDPEFKAAGPFAGLELSDVHAGNDAPITVSGRQQPVEVIIGNGEAALLAKVRLGATDIFMLSTEAVFDVAAERVTNLKAKESFSSLVPLLAFLRHAGVPCWRNGWPSANIVIDDVNLRRHYGFVELAALGRFVEAHDCAISLAFIPWNWSRASLDVAARFAAQWPKLSLCVHGCDHTAAEFSTGSVDATLPTIATALERMRALADRVAVTYDRVMVFPRGRFSAPAMEALRHSPFLAAFNTDVADDASGRGVAAGDLLAGAVSSYSGLPLFLRRGLNAPIEDYALDLMLGKPCVVVTHHDDFQDGTQRLASLVGALRAREPDLRWTTPEAIATRTYAIRRGRDATEIRLFSATTALTSHTGPIRFWKSEPTMATAFQVLVGASRVASERRGTDLTFRAVTTGPVIVEVQPSPQRAAAPTARPLRYRSRVAVRRYLSEFRDNYVATSPWARRTLAMVRPSHHAREAA